MTRMHGGDASNLFDREYIAYCNSGAPRYHSAVHPVIGTLRHPW